MTGTGLEFVAVCDVDGTLMTSHPIPSEIRAANRVRNFFDARGTFMVATAQTPEMLMSETLYLASVAAGFTRPVPLLGKREDGSRNYIAPETIACRRSFTDPDVIMSMGTGSYSRNGRTGPYIESGSLRSHLGWREAAYKMFALADLPSKDDPSAFLAAIESEQNYRDGKTDVFPLPYRFQFEFCDPIVSLEENKRRMSAVKEFIGEMADSYRWASESDRITDAQREELIGEFKPIMDSILIVDESRPSDNRLQFYMMPPEASKENLIEFELAKLAGSGTIEHLLIAGDMPPDLRAGCLAGTATHAVFVLAGGSPLVPYLSQSSNLFGIDYGSVSLQWIRDRLRPTNREGFVEFMADNRPPRTIVLGELAYPATRGPETIDSFVQEFYAR
ncbi:MAG: hypothetical protein AB199_02130 [Parcubacteria bacterium C7867-004]|nr:MAG: hypothetical protein AB199_02130 [Parcubacteria bacterium C7867-004]